MNILGYSIILSFLTFVNFSDIFTKIQGQENILTSLILPLTQLPQFAEKNVLFMRV